MLTFIPEPTKRKSKGSGAVSDRPYTDLYVSGLNIGLTHKELKTARYPFLINLIHSYIELNEPDDNKTRTATQNDIDMYL